MTVEERLARVEEQVQHLRDDIYELGQSVNGPNGGSVRSRLHVLETSNAAANAATAALNASQQLHRENWSRWQKLGVTLFAAIGAAGTVVSTLVLLQGGSQ